MYPKPDTKFNNRLLKRNPMYVVVVSYLYISKFLSEYWCKYMNNSGLRADR